MTARLIDRVYAQIPRQLRGRLKIEIQSDPYYLRVEVIVTGEDGVRYASGHCDNGILPDWFIAHICTIPVNNNQLMAQLWDSINHELDMADQRRQ